MELSQAFSEILEQKMFLPISKLGLDKFAHNAYKDFIEKSGIDDAHIIKNAFFLNLANTLETYSTSTNPALLTKSMEKTSLRTATILHGHAENFLQSRGESGKISHDLTAASIAAPILQEDVPNNKYIGLIGSEAFKLAYQSNKINDDPSLFKQESVSSEAKALHLSLLTRRMNASMTIIDHEIETNKTLSPLTHAAILEILEHTEELTLAPLKSSLENLVQRKYNIIQDIIDKTPVCDRTNIIDISQKFSHNDR